MLSRQLYVSLEFKGEVSCEDINLGVFNSQLLKPGDGMDFLGSERSQRRGESQAWALVSSKQLEVRVKGGNQQILWPMS